MSLDDGDARRRMLHRLDNLLEGVEQLRLRDRLQAPDRLGAEVAAVSAELGQAQAPASRSLARVHDHLFRLQALLLRGAGGRSMPPPPVSSAATQPPALIIPPRGTDDEVTWHERVRLIVQRARDRTEYLGAQAAAAARLPQEDWGPLAAERAAEAGHARESYERLAGQARRILGRPATFDQPPVLPTSGRLELADVVIDLDADEVRQGGRAVRMTPHERAVLAVLVGNEGRIVTREAMMLLVNGDNPRLGIRSAALNVHLMRVRAKLGDPPYLETITGVGFRATTAPALGPQPDDGLEEARQRRREQRRAWARRSTTPPAPPAQPNEHRRTRRAGP